MSGRVVSLYVSPKKVGTSLLVVALVLTFVSGIAQLANVLLGAGRYPLLSLLFVGEDASLPSWFSAVMLLACSVLLATIVYASKVAAKPYSVHWGVLAAIFLFLSIDEAISIHEKLSPVGKEMLSAAGTGGFIQRAWVVPAAIALVVLALLYARFFFRLPQRIGLVFLVALGLFFGGAIGVEALTDLYVHLSGGSGNLSIIKNLTRTIVLPHIEEFLEMVGVIGFLYALVLYA